MRTPKELEELSHTREMVEQAALITAHTIVKHGGGPNFKADDISDAVMFHLSLALAIAAVVKMDDDKEIAALKDENAALRKRLIPGGV